MCDEAADAASVGLSAGCASAFAEVLADDLADDFGVALVLGFLGVMNQIALKNSVIIAIVPLPLQE